MSGFVAILICLVLSAFFSGMEIAFMASNKLRIEIDKSNKGITQKLIDLFVSNSGMYITTILVGNNVVMVIYGIFMSDYLDPMLENIGISLGLRMVLVTLISTLIVLVTGEFSRKPCSVCGRMCFYGYLLFRYFCFISCFSRSRISPCGSGDCC